MKKLYRLTPTTSQIPVGLEFEAGICYISNPTNSPVLIRVGSPSIPTADNADYTIPALGKETISVVGSMFGLAFSAPSLVSTNQTANTASTCTVQFQTPNEPVPQFGAASFQTLSVSDLTNAPIPFSGNVTTQIFDITAWGGCQVYVVLAAGSGQAVLNVNVSADGVFFLGLGTYALWPGVPSVINIPRVMRKVQLFIQATAISGEPAITGYYSIRATITEIQNLVYNVSSQPITKTFALSANSSQQWQFVTVGLPSVSIAAIATLGTGASAATTLLMEASSDLINWRQVTFRTQRMSQGITLYRAVGKLDLFIRVSISEVGGISPLNGSLYLSIPPEADLGYILNTIQQALGDNSAPSNTNQDIYHQLDTIRTTEIGNNGYLLNLVNIGNAYEPGILTNTGTTATNTNGIRNDLTTINNNIVIGLGTSGTLHADLGPSGTLHADLGTLHADLGSSGTLHSDLVAINSNMAIGFGSSGTLHADLATINATLANNVSAIVQTTAVGVGGVWTSTGIALTPGTRVYGILASGAYSGIPTSAYVGVGIGQAGGAVTILYHYAGFIGGGTVIAGPYVSYASGRASGINIPAFPNNTILVTLGVAGTHFVTVVTGP